MKRIFSVFINDVSNVCQSKRRNVNLNFFQFMKLKYFLSNLYKTVTVKHEVENNISIKKYFPSTHLYFSIR